MGDDRTTIGLVVVGTPALTIAGITDSSFSPDLQVAVDASDGEVDPTYANIEQARPRFSLTTKHLATVLASAGFSGVEATTVSAYFTHLAAYGTRSAGSTHDKVAFAKAFIIPRTISWQGGSDVGLTIDTLAIASDGIVSPVSVTPDQALPAGGGIAQKYVFGKLLINDTPRPVDAGEWNFGLTEEVEVEHVFPTQVSVMNREPSLQITTPDAAVLGAIGAESSDLSGAIYFRKRTAGGLFVADNVAEHVSITWTLGQVIPEGRSGSQGSKARDEVTIRPFISGANPIIALSTTATIP